MATLKEMFEAHTADIIEATEILGELRDIPTQNKEVTAGTSPVTVTVDDGYILESVIVNPTPSQSKTVTPVPEGMTITPDAGKLLNQVILNGFEEGVSGIDYGSFSITYGETITEKAVYHKLGVTPKFVALVTTSSFNGYSSGTGVVYGAPNSETFRVYGNGMSGGGKLSTATDTSSSSYTTANATKINFKALLISSKTYYWFAIA